MSAQAQAARKLLTPAPDCTFELLVYSTTRGDNPQQWVTRGLLQGAADAFLDDSGPAVKSGARAVPLHSFGAAQQALPLLRLSTSVELVDSG